MLLGTLPLAPIIRLELTNTEEACLDHPSPDVGGWIKCVGVDKLYGPIVSVFIYTNDLVTAKDKPGECCIYSRHHSL